MAEKLEIGATKFDAKEKMEYAKRYFHERGNYRISQSNPVGNILPNFTSYFTV
jgi:hypothetical protein